MQQLNPEDLYNKRVSSQSTHVPYYPARPNLYYNQHVEVSYIPTRNKRLNRNSRASRQVNESEGIHHKRHISVDCDILHYPSDIKAKGTKNLTRLVRYVLHGLYSADCKVNLVSFEGVKQTTNINQYGRNCTGEVCCKKFLSGK